MTGHRLLALAALSLVAGLSAAEALERSLAAAEAGDLAAVTQTLLLAGQHLPDLDSVDGVALADRLAPLLRRVYLGPERFPGDEALGLGSHLVARGELPRQILRRYQLSNAHLSLLNPDYDDRRLGAGQRLKVLNLRGGRGEVRVHRGNYRCMVMHRAADGQLRPVAVFPVGIGTPDRPTPAGSTQVRQVVVNPEWRHPDSGRIIPPGHPDNLLGGFWIGLGEGDGRFRSIGFHGYTGAPVDDWIGQPGSRGCLRLLPDDIAALAALLRPGDVVQIE